MKTEHKNAWKSWLVNAGIVSGEELELRLVAHFQYIAVGSESVGLREWLDMYDLKGLPIRCFAAMYLSAGAFDSEGAPSYGACQGCQRADCPGRLVCARRSRFLFLLFAALMDTSHDLDAEVSYMP